MFGGFGPAQIGVILSRVSQPDRIGLPTWRGCAGAGWGIGGGKTKQEGRCWGERQGNTTGQAAYVRQRRQDRVNWVSRQESGARFSES